MDSTANNQAGAMGAPAVVRGKTMRVKLPGAPKRFPARKSAPTGRRPVMPFAAAKAENAAARFHRRWAAVRRIEAASAAVRRCFELVRARTARPTFRAARPVESGR